jgi:hypothetical protein
MKYNLGRINWVIFDGAEARAASEFVTGLENPQLLWDRKIANQIDRR